MPNGDDELLFGLVDIKGMGASAVTKLAAAKRERIKTLKKKGKKTSKPFKTVEQVAVAINNVGKLKALAAAGALRSLGVEPEVELQEELLRWQFTDPVKPYRKKYAKKIKIPKGNGKLCIVGEIVKTEKRKTKNGNDYVTWTVRLEPGRDFKINLWSDCFELFELSKSSIVMIEAQWSTQWENASINDTDQVRIFKRVVVSPHQKKKEKAA